MKSKLYNLSDGAKLIFNRQKDVNGIFIEFVFKAGALNDPEGKRGVAHFCEHALLSFSNAKMTKQEMFDYGLKFQSRNGYTNDYFVRFVLGTTEKNFENAIDFLTESFLSIKYSEEEFNQEKKIIEDEIKTRKKLNEDEEYYIFSTQVLDDENFKHCTVSPAGSMESLANITIEDLKEFIEKYFTKNNLIISICGNINKNKMLRIVNKYVNERIKTGDVSGFEVTKDIGLKQPAIHFREALEEGKARLVLFYLIKKVPSNYILSDEFTDIKILSPILQENIINFFRINNKLCYSCFQYLQVIHGNLFNKIEISCQQENLKEIISKFGEYITEFDKMIPIDVFEKHKSRILEDYNFDFYGIRWIADLNYITYLEEHKLFDKKYIDEQFRQYENVKYENIEKIYQTLFKTKPYICLITDKSFKDLSYNDLVFKKNQID